MTVQELRKKFIEDYAEKLLCLYGSAALGEDTFFKCVVEAREEMWDVTKQLILKADDSINVAWTDKDTQEKIEETLLQVANGSLSPTDGQKLISLISIGLESVELLNLSAQIAELNGE